MAEEDRRLRADVRAVEGDRRTRLSGRKPWTKPQVILSKAEHTQKVAFYTVDTANTAFAIGPS